MYLQSSSVNNNNNNNVHLSCAHQRPERSHDTYQPKYDILYTRRAQSYQNNLHNYLEKKMMKKRRRGEQFGKMLKIFVSGELSMQVAQCISVKTTKSVASEQMFYISVQ